MYGPKTPTVFEVSEKNLMKHFFSVTAQCKGLGHSTCFSGFVVTPGEGWWDDFAGFWRWFGTAELELLGFRLFFLVFFFLNRRVFVRPDTTQVRPS